MGSSKLRVWGAILALGLAYALIGTLTGFALPCPIHALTGLWCPGCGVTRLSLALLRLDFAAAWGANPALCLMGPVLAGLLVKVELARMRTGRTRLTKGESTLVWGMAAALLAFGVARNLPGLEFLAPHG